MATKQDIERRVYKKDISLDASEARGASDGAAPTVEGRPNANKSMLDAIIASPGDLLHRPDYGAGVPDYVGTLNSPTKRAQLINSIRRAVGADLRVSRVAASVATSFDVQTVVVQLQADLVGDDGATENTFNIGPQDAY